MKTKLIVSVVLSLFLILFLSKLHSQTLKIPLPDKSIEISNYDLSKQHYLYYKSVIKRGEIIIAGDVELQNKIFNTSQKNLTGPLPIGLTYVALQSIIHDLQTTLRTVTGDVAASINNLLATSNAVAAHWDARLADQLNETIDQLNKSERRVVEDTEDLIRMIQQTINQVQNNAIDLARITAGEADILAFNITSGIKRFKEARFVYLTPNKLRGGLYEPIIRIRGNFLNFKKYLLKLGPDKVEVTPISVANNEVVLKIPDSVIDGITSETTLGIYAEPFSAIKRVFWFGYRYFKSQGQSLSVVIKPKVNFSISVKIAAEAQVPTTNVFSYIFFDIDDDCNADRRVDRSYVLPPTWFISNLTDSPSLVINTGNCGSGLIGRGAYFSGDNMGVVEARIKGCGYSGPFHTFCNGRGWFGYTLRISAKSFQYQPIKLFETEVKIINQSQRSFTFEYPKSDVPSDSKKEKYSYNIIILVEEGTSVRRIELSDVNPNVEGIRTRMNDNKLSLEIDPLFKGKIREFK